jgi:hypothetical protein
MATLLCALSALRRQARIAQLQHPSLTALNPTLEMRGTNMLTAMQCISS